MFVLSRKLFLASFLVQMVMIQIQMSMAEIPIGTFKRYAHGLDSGPVTLKDTKTMVIRNFKYDGKGPDAWFQIKQRVFANADFTNPKEYDDLTSNRRIPDEHGSCEIVKGYNGQDVTLTLPSNLTFTNVEYVALYCYQYKHNFGYINIPQNVAGLNLYPSDKTPPEFCSGASGSIIQLIKNSSALFTTASLILLSSSFSYILM